MPLIIVEIEIHLEPPKNPNRLTGLINQAIQSSKQI